MNSSNMFIEETSCVSPFERVYNGILFEKLNSFLNRGEFCDVRVEVGDKIFSCNRIFLAANSSLFQKLFNEAEKEELISVENVDAAIFAKLLTAIYGGPLHIGKDVIALYVTSVNLQLDYFIEKCREFIISNLDVINLIELLRTQELIEDLTLYPLIKRAVCKKFFNLCKTDLCQLPFMVLKDLITDPDLVFDELRLLDLVKSWVKYDLQNRWQCLKNIAILLHRDPTVEANKFVLMLKKQPSFSDDFKLNMAVSALFDFNKYQSFTEFGPVDKFKMLFLMKSNDELDASFTSYQNGSFIFFDDFLYPLKSPVSDLTEGTVCDHSLFLVARNKEFLKSKIEFGCYNLESGRWMNLHASPEQPASLITCNSKCISYQWETGRDIQIRAYYPFLDHWFALPAVKNPRCKSGLASDGKIIYLVGGMSIKNGDSDSPANIIEYYDERTKYWYQIKTPDDRRSVEIRDCWRKVVIKDWKLFVLDCHFKVFDLRINNWVYSDENVSLEYVKYVTANEHSVWGISSEMKTDIQIYDVSQEQWTEYSTISKPGCFLKPIFVPF